MPQSFYVEKHCAEPTCAHWVIRWRTCADSDGVPCIGLWWDEMGGQAMVFPNESDADLFAARMNKVFDIEGTDN